MAEKDKVTLMVLNVDIQCSKCYKKVKKLLCKFPEIRDQTYDEKANKVTIKVVCCSPEKIRDKLCCKAGGCIKSIEIKDDQKKPGTIMVLDVDLQCSECYKKVKKLLCKFPEIRDQTYDEKANKVTIKVVSCSPEKIRDKLRCKGGRSVKNIVIKEPEKPKEKKKKEDTKKRPDEKKEEKKDETKDDDDDNHDTDIVQPGQLRYPPPASPVIGFWCSESSSHSGIPGNPCPRGGPVQYVGYYGRPIYGRWGGGCSDYFSEENQQSCSIM